MRIAVADLLDREINVDTRKLRLVMAAGAALALALLVLSLGQNVVLGAIVFGMAATAVLLWPHAVTVAVVFIVYTNLPVALTRFHGVPQVLAASLVLLLVVPLVQHFVLRREPPRLDRTFFWMILLLVSFLISTLVAKDRLVALTRVQTYVAEGILLYWLVINVVRGMPAMRRVVWSLLAAGALLGGLSAYQSATGSYQQQFGGLAMRNYNVVPGANRNAADAYRLYGYHRAQGPVNEPNRFAQILIVLLPLAAFVHRSARSRRERLLAASAAGLILAGIVLTYSRGAALTLLVVIAALVALRWLELRKVIIVAVALMVALPIVSPRYASRIASIGAVRQLMGDRTTITADGAIRGRATEMLAAVHVFADHPVLGVGPGQYMPFYSEQYHQTPTVQYRQIKGQRRAHSLFPEFAAETGIIGLTIFCGLLLQLMRSLWRARRACMGWYAESEALATAFLLSLLAYLGTGVFLHLAYERYLWLLVALASAALHIVRQNASTRAVAAERN